MNHDLGGAEPSSLKTVFSFVNMEIQYLTFVVVVVVVVVANKLKRFHFSCRFQSASKIVGVVADATNCHLHVCCPALQK